jgi:hypothetical protein
MPLRLRGLALVVLQQTAQSLPTPHRCLPISCSFRVQRKQDRSPSSDFLSLSARLTVQLPHPFAVDRQAKLRSVEFVGDELSVPGQQRFRLRDSRQFFQGFPSEPLGDLRQRRFFTF